MDAINIKHIIKNSNANLQINAANQYVLVYTNNKFRCYGVLEKTITLEIPINSFKLLAKNINTCTLFLRINAFIIRFDKFIIDNDPPIYGGAPFGCKVFTNTKSKDDLLRLYISIHDYNNDVTCTTFMKNGCEMANATFYDVKPKYHTEIFNMLSLLYYISPVKTQLRLTPHCLPHMLNTYFIAIPHDITKIIFQYCFES